MLTRRLSLRREALTALTTDELTSVAGGRDHTFPDLHCVTYEVDRTIVILTPGPIIRETQPCTS